MRKAVIKGQAFICVILSFVGLVNHGVWIWMTGRTKQKKLQLAGIFSLVLCIVSAFLVGIIKNETMSMIMSTVISFFIFAPIVVNCINLKTFMNCQSLWSLVKKHQVRIGELAVDAYNNIQVYPDELTVKNSQRLFGEKGDAVLRAIQYGEWEVRDKKERKKREEEWEKEEIKRMEKEKAKAEAEKIRVEAEAKKIETERAKAEAEKMRAEAEAKKMEAERIQRENKRIEAEKIKAEVEKEKAKAEAEKLEMERQKLEAEKKRAEAEVKKMEMEREEKARLDYENRQKEMLEKEREQMVKNSYTANNRKIDINLCTEQELSLVPGVGIILAKKAIRIRNEKGNFSSVDEFIQEIGIRENNVERVRNMLVCVAPQKHTDNGIKKRGRKIDL